MDEIVQPKPAVRFEISQSLNGTKIVYIARDHGGVVRLRSENLEALERMILEYRLPEPSKPAVDKEAIVNDKLDALVETVVEAQAEEEAKKTRKKKTLPSDETGQGSPDEATEEKKEFLKNELKEAIEEQKEKTTKKSFWDRLK